MYKRKSRTPRNTTPTRVTTSTPKYQSGNENDPGRNSLPSQLSSLTFSQQRKGADDQIPSKNLKRIRCNNFGSYFEEVVTEAGYIFQQGDNQHFLSQDQAVFSRDVDLSLKKNPLYPKNIEDFIAGFEKYCSENSNLKKILTHTKTSPDCEDARGPVQESLVRRLLSVECLQPRISEILLEKVAEFAFTGDDDPDTVEEVPWVRIILRQMRLLDHIVDGNTLNEHLFAVLDAAPLPVQQEIIFCLPDIIGDEQHHEAALQLSKLLRTNFQLTAAIMEALDNLSLENTLRAEVCKLMLQTLNKAPPEFLPAIVGFLISSDEPFENLVEVVSDLRKKLDLNLVDGLDGSNQVLMLSALHSGALSSQRLADIWMKAISSAHSPSELYPLDIVVLLLLHSSIPGLRKQVQNVLRSHIKAGIVTEALIEKTFTIFLAAIKEYLKSALEIATTLFKSPDPPVSYLGSVWFKLMLIHLEHYQSQSIILELLLLIGTCSINIARSALQVLASVESNRLQQHTLVLMGLLDNLQDMDLVQVGHVMDLLCSLVYGGHVDSLHEDEIHMLIRKHLSSSSDMLKQKGVVGAVMALKHMATSESDSQENIQSSSSTDDSHLSERANHAKGLLELVLESVQNSVACVGLLYDQLAAVVCSCNTLDISFLKWIAEEIADRFQDYFVTELKEVSKVGYVAVW